MSMLLGMFYNMVKLVDYSLRYTYYATVLCENQDKPAMKCNGQCQLMKNAVDTQGDQKPALPELLDLRLFNTTLYQSASWQAPLISLDKSPANYRYLGFSYQVYLSRDLPPPKLV